MVLCLKDGAERVGEYRAGTVVCTLWLRSRKLGGSGVGVTVGDVGTKPPGVPWAGSVAFGRDEIPLLVYCLRRAYEEIIETPWE